MEIAIGALVTVIVQTLKKVIVKSAAISLSCSFLFSVYWWRCYSTLKVLFSVDFLKRWYYHLTQFAIWGVFVKYIWPKDQAIRR